ncbi:uncharacterized protein N7482_003791 [Penicillium canariense]|uniref:Protein phosphatase 4 core regulatory subunit R2 n=1 Tax=Penicillium canariense TaxID=189055 RepID=A0A9W9IB26_9EURO|nr:uncharacterized protein N7482_003791 [Penicillium canariense]KAJ5168197.1 hypothetical protein N7482_003791 [Penicillium canariense]
MSLDEEALEAVANGGSIDLYIVYEVFPMPQAPPSSYNAQPFHPPSEPIEIPESSNKENAAPEEPQTFLRPQATTGSPPSSDRIPDSQPQPSSQQTNDTLPPPLALLLGSIRSSIQSFFVEKPPHTVQRLAELILRPTAHYRTLPAYLRAVDRVVSVTSCVDVFPFNGPSSASAQPNGLMHPTNSAGTYLAPDYTSGLGSDESLGGALLTPIPWLTNASFTGEGANILEGRMLSLNGLRVNLSTGADWFTEEPAPIQPQQVETTSTATAEGEEEAKTTSVPSPPAESPDEVPHARGPPVLGVEDLGLQDGKGVEMNLGEEVVQDGASEPSVTEANQGAGESGHADKDGDIVLDDTKPKEETKTEDTTAASSQAGEETSEAISDPEPVEAEKKE